MSIHSIYNIHKPRKLRYLKIDRNLRGLSVTKPLTFVNIVSGQLHHRKSSCKIWEWNVKCKNAKIEAMVYSIHLFQFPVRSLWSVTSC